MSKIIVNNPRQVINGGAKKYYFKVKGLGGPKGDKGDKGDTGQTGPQGPQGNAATVSVGSTTTLPVGYDATVENVGSIYNAVLNFGIPQGPQGPQGATGAKGDKGDKGEQGNPGPQGEKGTNATVTVGTTTTTGPGTQAYAWNSSSNPNNAVINFNIPRGATGAQGPQGPQGPAGPQGQCCEPTIVNSLPTTGDEGKLYLTPKNYTTGTASGNPITVSLDEDEGAIDSFQLDGDTFQQTYTGKNLFDGQNPDTRMNYIINDSGNEVADSTGGYTRNYSKVLPETQYILSGLINAGTRRIYYYDNSKNFISRSDGYDEASTITFTTPANCYYVNVQIYTRTDTDTEMAKWQIEAGSTVTSFEPFVGGQPSPSPDYPQQVQTVTGEQTISINGTDHEIDLGSIELCKLDTYQDYIWKDGDDWKVHKATGKHLFNGGEAFTFDGSNQGIYQFRWTDSSVLNNSNQTIALVASDKFRGVIWNRSWTKDFSVVQVVLQTALRFMTSLSSSVEGFKAWLASNNTVVHYVLATEADTTITDAALIAQLEAVRTASLGNGTNTITNTATAPNLAGDMEIGYYEFDPTNRYDKWLWLDINNNYEKLGS